MSLKAVVGGQEGDNITMKRSNANKLDGVNQQQMYVAVCMCLCVCVHVCACVCMCVYVCM